MGGVMDWLNRLKQFELQESTTKTAGAYTAEGLTDIADVVMSITTPVITTAAEITLPSPATLTGSADHYQEPAKVETTRAGIVWGSPPRCYVCKSVDLWQTTQGDTRCRRCHPPAPGAEVSD